MTAIKHTLQREVFLPSDERLFSVVHATKEGKRKKASFLCVAVTTEKPIQVTLYQVKKQEKGESFKKKSSWALRQLRIFDAKFIDKEVAEFELHFEKAYKWVASSIAEKNAFIQSLWKLSQLYLVQKPDFINVQIDLLEDTSTILDIEQTNLPPGSDLGANQELNWQALTSKEESDLELLMSQFEFAIANAETFADQLAKDLSVLDGANIHSIMGSEDQVLALMHLLDIGVEQAEALEKKLNDYEKIFQGVKDLMETMKDKEALISIRNRNHKRLLEQLEGLVNKLNLDQSYIKALLESDLASVKGIQECTLAAKALLKCFQADIPTSLEKMIAVQEQKKKFYTLKNSFAKRLSHHLNNLFIHEGNELGGGTMLALPITGDLKLPSHATCYRQLMPYCQLMNWLKIIDEEIYVKLRKVYCANLSKLFEQQIKDFMMSVRNHVTYQLKQDKRVQSPPSLNRLLGVSGQNQSQHSSSSSLNRSLIFNNTTLSNSHSNSAILGSGSNTVSGLSELTRHSSFVSTHNETNCSSEDSDMSVGSRALFDQAYEHVLNELENWCLAEQDFCVRFFSLANAEDKEQQQAKPKQNELEHSDGPWVPTAQSIEKQYKINKEIRGLMGELFISLEGELIEFESFGNNLNQINILHMLVRVGEHVLKAEDTGSFLSKTFANCLVQIKRNFDKYIEKQIQDIKEFKINKKSRVGIIPFVLIFEEFAKNSEAIFRSTHRRTDLDKAYSKLIETIFSEIGRVAMESQKMPPEVIHFENYHRLLAIFSQLKIASLDLAKKEAKKRYQEWLQVYVVANLGRPLEKVNIFFDGIEAKISSGIRAEDAGFQVQFSRQELKKVIKEYSGKEVKRGLEQLYKKVDKHLCEEENLLQVVWHTMQDEFIKQYKYFEQMIQRCYIDSGVTFEFTIDDLLNFFSDIAQSH